MPWTVMYGHADCDDDQWSVVKDDDGTVVECFDERADAVTKITELYQDEQLALTAAAEVDEPDDDDVQTGAMIALVPISPDADRLALMGGEFTSDLHATVIYLGEAADFPDAAQADLIGRVKVWAEKQGPIIADARGVAAFNPMGDDPCLVALLSGPELADVHEALVAEFGEDASADQHRPWIPHVTLMYDTDPSLYMLDALAACGPVVFDRLRVAFAGVTTDIPLLPPAPAPPEDDPQVVDEPVDGEMAMMPMEPEPADPMPSIEVVEPDPEDEGRPLVAAGYTIVIPELPAEEDFDEPDMAELPPFGAISITASGRIIGLIAPRGVVHRAYRESRSQVMVPTGQDYTEFNNKPVIVASRGGGAPTTMFCGSLTFDCGHADAFDPRRADPTWAREHYDNSCSIAGRVYAGEHSRTKQPYVVGRLVGGLTASSFERLMGCAVSGDWQGGKFNAALLVPVEGFPTSVPAGVRLSVREDGAMVASSYVPIKIVPDNLSERQRLEALAKRVGLDAGSRFNALYQRVNGRGY